MQLEQKKQKKKSALLKSAYTLFLKQGAEATSVGDITAEAGVAKGTFYLYFRDKQDIVSAVVNLVARQILEEAYLKMCAVRSGNFAEDIASLANAILDILERSRPLLAFVGRDFRFPSFREKMNRTGNPVWRSLRADLKQYAALSGIDEKELLRRIYCLVSMCGSVACAAVLDGEPADLPHMRPSILAIIRGSLPGNFPSSSSP